MDYLYLGIMQPYFFPYIGYWQLISAVDKYVVFDDVNYINRGWINRNIILYNGESRYFNVRIHKASQNKRINELTIFDDAEKSLDILFHAYKNAPYYKTASDLIESIFKCGETNLSEFLLFQIKEICNYLDIKTEIIKSSDIDKDLSLHGQDKVMDICKRFGATHYINAIGGRGIYNSRYFAKRDVILKFLDSQPLRYSHYGKEIEERLSIIDVMMFNSVNKIKEYLENYRLID